MSNEDHIKLEIHNNIKPISILGQFDPQDIWSERQVFIDHKRCPPMLSMIILAGLDTLMNEYLNTIEESMIKEGHKI